MQLLTFLIELKSAKYILHKIGPKIDPWGVPVLILKIYDIRVDPVKGQMHDT